MVRLKKETLLWSAAGLLLSLLALLVVFHGLTGNTFVTDPMGIAEAADSIMTSIRTEDWESLGLQVSGSPELMPETGDEDSVQRLIWDTYLQSLQWTCEDGWTVQGSYVTQKVTVTCLDISKVTGNMALILKDTTSAPAIIEQSLRTAAEQVLSGDLPMTQKEVILMFACENGCWKLVPNNVLLALLSGFTGS